MPAVGTVTSSLLNFLGLDEIRKDIVFLLLKKTKRMT